MTHTDFSQQMWNSKSFTNVATKLEIYTMKCTQLYNQQKFKQFCLTASILKWADNVTSYTNYNLPNTFSTVAEVGSGEEPCVTTHVKEPSSSYSVSLLYVVYVPTSMPLLTGPLAYRESGSCLPLNSQWMITSAGVKPVTTQSRPVLLGWRRSSSEGFRIFTIGRRMSEEDVQ